MLIDTHAHIDAADFDGDRDAVLSRARDAGVGAIIVAGAARSVEDLERTADCADMEIDGVELYATAGVHPHEARHFTGEHAAAIAELAGRPRIVAVGETGLDYHYNHSPPEIQRQVFARQIEIAREVGLPVVCHIRDAHDEAREILDASGAAEVGAVIHCFTGDPDDAAAYVERGFYISLSGIVTFGASAEPIREAVRRIPADRILVETDSPYLAPVPMRGKRNEPAFVAHTAARIAQLRGITEAELAELTTANARAAFDLPGNPKP